MTFEERKKTAQQIVAAFLSDYVPPRGLDDKSLASRIISIADAFARRMPTAGDFADAVEAVLMRMRDTHESNTWPTQAVFVMAMPGTENKSFAKVETFKTDELERNAKLMMAGEGVAEGVIWGPMASALDIPAQTLDRYRKGSAAHWQSVCGRDAHTQMRGKLGCVVDPYFVAAREAAE